MELKYKFSYGGKFKMFISKAILLIYNCFCGVLFDFLYAFIVFEINYCFKNRINARIMDKLKFIEICFGIIIMIVFIFISFLPQKAKITDDKVKVYRHCIFFMPFTLWRGFNDSIPINKIEDIYIAKNRDKYLEPIPVNVIDWKNMVIIHTDLNYFYVPVKNSEDFINQVNMRIERVKFLEKYDLNRVITARGISPEQIKFRWKSQDKVESIYYIDCQGNKVDIPLPNSIESDKLE